MRGLLSEEQYKNALLQIDLSEMGIGCPTWLLPELRENWRAFCREPKKYADTVVAEMVAQWIEEYRK